MPQNLYINETKSWLRFKDLRNHTACDRLRLVMSVFGGTNGAPGFSFAPQLQQEKSRNGTGQSGFNDPRRSGSKKYTKNENDKNGNKNGNGNSTRQHNNKKNTRGDKKKTYVHNESSNGGFNSSPSPSSYSGLDPLDMPNKVIPRQNPSKLQSYSEEEKQITGPICSNPESLGFRRINQQSARPIPKYMLHQPRLLVTPTFHQDPWDKQNQDKMLSMEQSNSGDYQGLYEEFQKMRETERKQMEVLGLVDAENISKDLNDAISFQGSCVEMCPIFERVRRALENNVKALEKDPVTNKISRERAVKAFSRPAAGQPPPLPSEVRPPQVLSKTLDYMIDYILPQLPEAHSFIWDRTRSIRQDFTYQNFFGPEAIDCNEKIVRIHLVSLHIMAASDIEYSQQQELEQFNKALQTLLEIYQDVRNHGGEAPNEAEFRAYYLLSHIRDPEQEREIQTLPPHILENNFVQLALMFRNTVLQSDIVERGYTNTAGSLSMFLEFFRMVYSPQVPFLMSCLLETHFNEIRFYALKSMSRSYHTKSKPYSAEKLLHFLGFDTVDKLVKFVQYYDIDVVEDPTNGSVAVDLFNKEKWERKYKLNSLHDKPKLSQPYSPQLDVKFPRNNLKQLIDSGFSNADLKIKKSSIFKVLPPTKTVNKTAFSTATTPFASTLNTTPSLQTVPQKQQPILPNSASTTLSGFLGSSQTAKPIGLPQISFSSAPLKLENNLPKIEPQPIQNSGLPVFGTQVQPAVQFSNLQQFGTQLSVPSIVTPKPRAAPSSIKPPSIPSFNFGKSEQVKPALEVAPQKPETSLPTTTSSTFTFGSKPADTGETPVKQSVSNSLTNGIPPPNVTVAPPVVVKKRIVDLPHFSKAAEQVLNSMLNDTINNELSKMLPKLMKKQDHENKRKYLISSISKDIYEKLMSEYIHQKALESYADSIYSKKLKLNAIRNLVKTGKMCISKQKLKKRKLNELELITFDNNATRKKVKHAQPIKKPKVELDLINYIDESQKSIQDLWEPINLQNFINKVSKKFKVNIQSKDIELNFLLLIENWDSDYSKWLNNKLSLRINHERLQYENILRTDKLRLTFTSLPPTYDSNNKFFSKSPFILFDCGFTTMQQVSEYSSIHSKLESDKLKLTKLVKLINSYSFYKVQIAILYWDISEVGLTEENVWTALDLEKYRENNASGQNSVQDIFICDMTLQDPPLDGNILGENINRRLENVFEILATNFRGSLSNRGNRKLEKKKNNMLIKQSNATEARALSVELTDSVFKSTIEKSYRDKEAEQISSAKALRKYDYLSKHMASNTTGSQIGGHTNNSANSTAFVTASNKSQLFPRTFLNTTMNDTTMNNVSILGGFGNGIVGASTPCSSPGKIKKPSMNNIPKGLQELRDLAQGIKRKYAKK